MTNKHYLITGGAGFIGSNLIRTLFSTEPECRITCIDNFDPFYSVQIKEFNIAAFGDLPGFRLIRLDLGSTSAEELERLITEPIDLIIHLAAKAGVRPSIDNPLAYQQSNVIGLQHVLDFARSKKIKQFIFGSSSSVYGINDHFPWKEEEQLMPVSPYASSKLAGEMLGHVYSRSFGIRFIALRFFTVYGPGQRPDLAIHKFTKAILTGAPVTFYGDGSTSRDYTYVDDVIKGILSAVHYNATGYEIINLGNHYAVSLKHLLEAIEKVTGMKGNIQYLPEQAGDVPKTFADISKAKRLLNYDPHTPLEEGLEQFVEWFTVNKNLLAP